MTHELPNLKVTIQRPHGVTELLDIEQARILIGSGAHCDIRIDGAGAASEHVVVETRGGELLVRGLSMAPPAFSGGQPLTEARLPSGSEIAVCGTRITFQLAAVSARSGRRTGTRIAAALLAGTFLIAIPGLVYARLQDDGSSSLGRMPAPVALFDAPPPSCKADGEDQALAVARRSHALGLARRERHPFAVEEGVLAVAAFRVAALCFRRAGHGAEAEAASGEGAALEAIIERDYFVHRVRLEHSVETDDLHGALVEVRVLRRMTAQRKGPYADWLVGVERRVEAANHEAEDKALAGSAAFGTSP